MEKGRRVHVPCKKIAFSFHRTYKAGTAVGAAEDLCGGLVGGKTER